MPQSYIGFEESFVHPILRTEKYQTLRHGWRSFPDVGDVVDLRTSDGHVFARARIKAVKITTVDDVVENSFDGHRDYNTVDEFISHLEQYYDNISPDDDIVFIDFEVVDADI